MLTPDPLNYGWRDYGPRVGVWRMMDVLDRYSMRASVMLNSDVCEHYPQIIEAGRERGWRWLAHGKNNSIFHTGMAEDEERAYLSEVTDTIAQATGRAPKGWLGPALTETFNTPRLLAELGFDYVCDWCNDDQPYPLRLDRGRLVSVPYSIEVNDIPLFVGQGISGEAFYRVLVDQFDVLYAEGADSGRVMGIGLHPFLVGLPFRITYLERALAYIAGHDDVWLTTSDEIVEHYLSVQQGEAID
ncbi:MAG: polysaccharide deacetylase family protein [Euzebyales bacterium]|nr:polysaccharide deacetylase family protein [Euzebyales bacterium]